MTWRPAETHPHWIMIFFYVSRCQIKPALRWIVFATFSALKEIISKLIWIYEKSFSNCKITSINESMIRSHENFHSFVTQILNVININYVRNYSAICCATWYSRYIIVLERWAVWMLTLYLTRLGALTGARKRGHTRS